MYAYTYNQYGGPEVIKLTQVATPSPDASSVLIRVSATTVSAGDWRARSLNVPAGMGLIARLVFGIWRPRKPILGTEFSGIVEKVGAEVTRFQPGDAVIGFPGAGLGAHAEYIVMPENGKIVHKPDQLGFREAAAIPFGATTAYDFLVNKGQLRKGERILVNGASGAVGSACVQIARHLGARVSGVCSAANADLVRALGADHVIEYDTQDFSRLGLQFDMVVDTVGNAPWGRTRRALAPGGRMVMIAGSTSDMLFGAMKARLNGKRLIGGIASESRDVLQSVVDLASKGHFAPVIDRSFDFSQMVAAHSHVDTGHKKGNVVVSLMEQAEPGAFGKAATHV